MLKLCSSQVLLDGLHPQVGTLYSVSDRYNQTLLHTLIGNIKGIRLQFKQAQKNGSVSEKTIQISHGIEINTSGPTLIFGGQKIIHDVILGGQKIVAAPKESDSQFTYSFFRWSMTSNIVNGDMIITAIFTATENS